MATALERAIRGWLDHLRVERGVSVHTLKAYTRDLDRYRHYLAGLGIDEAASVGENEVSGFLAHLRQGDEDHQPLAASSAARSLVAVRGFHKFLALEGDTATNAAEGVAPPTPARRLPKAISQDEVTRLIDAAGVGDTPNSLRDKAILELMYGIGARVSEVTGLDVDDVDLETDTVRVLGKGDKERLLPLGSFAKEAVQAYLVRARPDFAIKGRGTPALFLNGRGGRLSRQSVWNLIQACGERADLKVHLSPHTLRHSFATHLLDGGADVRVVQELLGHASVTTTQIYTLVTVQQLREVFAGSHPRALDPRGAPSTPS